MVIEVRGGLRRASRRLRQRASAGEQRGGGRRSRLEAGNVVSVRERVFAVEEAATVAPRYVRGEAARVAGKHACVAMTIVNDWK